jgi:hypothetical protein
MARYSGMGQGYFCRQTYSKSFSISNSGNIDKSERTISVILQSASIHWQPLKRRSMCVCVCVCVSACVNNYCAVPASGLNNHYIP